MNDYKRGIGSKHWINAVGWIIIGISFWVFTKLSFYEDFHYWLFHFTELDISELIILILLLCSIGLVGVGIYKGSTWLYSFFLVKIDIYQEDEKIHKGKIIDKQKEETDTTSFVNTGSGIIPIHSSYTSYYLTVAIGNEEKLEAELEVSQKAYKVAKIDNQVFVKVIVTIYRNKPVKTRYEYLGRLKDQDFGLEVNE
ncbi:hypothetical protein M2139_001513 [Enterococcus sp. PF1-24]|uniref:hypothetical protein n=1 Tax=unclassified Enterococcus TaxID=2608891 RepID=UPI002475775E|nr:MULTISPECIES: hypothetical protein [unclassified Enterococcus]MDH6364496.1 hypothetical protein [Enterococcus sp. PFB1-1]MDH6401627.1 hypothetical protein [Enterococcus sp. PF1-24]